jgi:hypothetical protein
LRFFTAVVAVVVLAGTVVMLGKGPTVRASDIDTDILTVSAIFFSKFRSNPIASSLQNGGF